jgi:hypothetical protein
MRIIMLTFWPKTDPSTLEISVVDATDFFELRITAGVFISRMCAHNLVKVRESNYAFIDDDATYCTVDNQAILIREYVKRAPETMTRFLISWINENTRNSSPYYTNTINHDLKFLLIE